MKAQTLIPTCVVAVLGVLLASAAFGQFQYEQLKFLGPADETGVSPTSLIEGSDAALYGTTAPACFATNGLTCFAATVFRLNRDGSGYAVLHRFAVTNADTGGPAIVSLIEGSDGALYGATQSGGFSNVVGIFKLNRDGSGYLVLRSLSLNGGDGIAGLVEGRDGVLYGTTYDSDGGTVFELNKDGSDYRLVHTFMGGDGDGSYPTAALIQCSDGFLYGTTAYGGINNGGTAFKFNNGGSNYAVLHSFGSEGYAPVERLIEGSDGILYGVTAGGGSNDWGTVFKLNRDGSDYAVLHDSSGAEGEGSPSSLLEGGNGVLYGTKRVPCHERCLMPGFGSVFTLKKDGSGYAVLHGFASTNVAARARGIEASALVKGSDGALYGTTWSGGDMNLGMIFTLRPQPVLLPPVVAMDGVIVRFTSHTGSTNQVQRVGTLGESWLTLTTLVAPTNGVVEFTDRTGSQQGAFYRVVQVQVR